MTYLAVMLFASAIALPKDTTFTLGTVHRDLTGDGWAERLRLVATGPSLDSLDVTLFIESSGSVLFRAPLVPLTRRSFDPGRRRLTLAEHRVKLREYPNWFFGPRKFVSPSDFVSKLSSSAPAHVARIPVVIAGDRRSQLVRDSLITVGFPRVDAERRAAATRFVLGQEDSLHAVAVWREIQDSGVTVFEFSRGGDFVTAIAWSPRDRRFYRLLECC